MAVKELSTDSSEAFVHESGELSLLHAHDRRIPASWQYSLRRHRMPQDRSVEESGSLAYCNEPSEQDDRRLELFFRVRGRMCHPLHFHGGDMGRAVPAHRPEGEVPTVDSLLFRFEPSHLALYARSARRSVGELLRFTVPGSFTRSVVPDRRMRATLETLVDNTCSGEAGNIVVNAQTQILLLQTLQQLYGDPDEAEVPACKFLDNAADREKIANARDILIGHIGDPITIKALSRKVAINECYLKKGFKVMFGCTIFDFYQDQRMEHAKFLLHERGRTVSEVSAMLGYSSISHFSTAFKKHTGLKPCELLSR